MPSPEITPRSSPVKKIDAPMVSVITGQSCIGFILKRGLQGVEAFDANERSLGLFGDPIQAAAAVECAALACPRCSAEASP
jgi:hypothetical protein